MCLLSKHINYKLSSNSGCGARRGRTADLLLARQALSQLSYGPLSFNASRPYFPTTISLSRNEKMLKNA